MSVPQDLIRISEARTLVSATKWRKVVSTIPLFVVEGETMLSRADVEAAKEKR